MGLVSTKILILLITIFLIVGYSIAIGLIRWEPDPYKCLYGRRFVTNVPRQRLITAGPLHIYYQPYSYECPNDFRYDASKYETVDGELMLKSNH